MKPNQAVIVLGGGLSGMAAAYALARSGFRDITLIERGRELGGLAGTFEREGHFYPLAYHHINQIDRPLLYFLDAIGSLEQVRWRNIRMLFRVGGQLYDLRKPRDFIRFPMGALDKLRFARLMLCAFRTADWEGWQDRSAAELVDRWGGPGVREAIFEPLCRLKFNLSCQDVSGAWLGARLHHREGSSALGYIPGRNWTQVLCQGVADLLDTAGVRIRCGTAVVGLRGAGGAISEVEVDGGERLGADLVISTVPTQIYRNVVDDPDPVLAAIRYTAAISVVCTAKLAIDVDFYWMNLASPRCSASAIFVLNSLNPTIGAPGESCINFVTHLRSCDDEFFNRSDEQLIEAYRRDFYTVFRVALDIEWVHVARIPIYSPIFGPHYQNPPIRSATWRNVFFAGNYRTFPSIVSTGTALWSGLEAAEAVLQEQGESTDLIPAVRAFELGSIRERTESD